MDTKSRKSKRAGSFLCFVLGVTLLLFSCLGALWVLVNGSFSDLSDALKRDYQDTRQFQSIITNRLTMLRRMGEPGYIDGTYDPGDGFNLLYEVRRDGEVVLTNTDGLAAAGELPEGYSFRLYFDGEKVTIEKHGKALDVYGDGWYRPEENDWYVPGYHNLSAEDTLYGYEPEYGYYGSVSEIPTPTVDPAPQDTGEPDRSAVDAPGQTDANEGEDLVTVCMAAAEEPVYWENGNDRLYYLVQELSRIRAVLLALALIPAAGLALLIFSIVLWKHKLAADQAIARVAGHIWLEFKLLALIPLGFLIYGAVYTVGALLSYNYNWSFLLCVPAALWWIYLYCNDLLYNGTDFFTHSFCAACVRLFRTGELKYPIQKRLSRRAVLQFAAAIPFIVWAVVFMVILLPRWYWNGGLMLLWVALVIAGLALLAAQVLLCRRTKATANELGLLLDRIEAAHSGDLGRAAPLPEDSDLRRAADCLDDIESGLKAALEEQTRSERMKVELIANVSHDLKTPLTSIISYAELLGQEEDLPDHVRDYVRILNEKAARLKTMVQEVFEVSKAASGNLPVQTETLDLSKLLRQTMADMAEPIDASPLIFRTQLPENGVFIRADGDRLYRVFQNLIQNALQYSLPGSRVYLTLTTQVDTATVRMQNTSKEELPQNVDFTARFVRGDESRTDGGSGLGLSIARTFTEACGGSFRVIADADLFTAVVSFPVAQSPAKTDQ